MQYPLISEYVEAIRSAEDNFDQLSDLRPVLDSNGNPVMSSGNFAVVFKMQNVNTKQLFAVKCFTREQAKREEHYRKIADELEFTSSPYLLHFSYLEDELFVDTTQGSISNFPIVVMDWAEGVTLDNYLKAHLHDPYALQLLAYRFCRMGAWLLSQPFAHGDLKPDNILVKKDGSLVLVDYDGMFVPALQGENASELGSPDFRHPLRTETNFNEHIDDFVIASIALSLKAIALQPALYDQFATADRLLLSASDYRDIGKSAALQAILALSSDAELGKLFSAFLLASSLNSLDMLSFRLFILQQPEKPKEEIWRTDVTDEDRQNAVEDEFGILYSADGMRLIGSTHDLGYLSFFELESYDYDFYDYDIKEGTKVICDNAFACCKTLYNINIPNSVTHIGRNPFYGCPQLRLTANSSYFQAINGLLISSSGILISCLSKDTHVQIPNSVNHIGDGAFGGWPFEGFEALQSVNIPNSVTQIGNSAFCDRWSLQNINIPNSVNHIGDDAFEGCEALQSVNIPNSVTHIGRNPFCNSHQLQLTSDNPHFKVINGLLISSSGILISCLSKETHINIPNSVNHIGDSAFYGCKALQSINIPNSVTHIGNSAFSNCEALQNINIPNSVNHIGDNAFAECI